MTLDGTSPHAQDSESAQARQRLAGTVAAISNPTSLKGLVAAIAGAIVLLLPTLTTIVVDTVVFVAVVATAVIEIAYALTGERRVGMVRRRLGSLLRGLTALLFAAVMVVLFVVADDGASLGVSLIVSLTGLYVAVRGLIVTVSALARRSTTHRGLRLTGGTTAIVLGFIAVVAPDSVSNGVLAGAAVTAMVFGLILVAWGLRRAEVTTSRLDPATATPLEVVWDWIRGSDVGDRRREELAETLFYEAPERLAKRVAWWTMLVLSVAIATYAVLADSTAVVIGAMLVAPLMAPILGLAGAIVNGWRWRAVHSAATVTMGVVVSIALSYGLTAWAPVAVAFDTNSQIVSRVDPTMLDMLIAIAAGAAGAFATVDKRVSSSIAGVAIAVALVPPLAVVGVALQGGHGADARGAFLLFLTNFVAIVLSASVVFVLTGFARYQSLRANFSGILTTVIPFVALASVILVPLMFTSEGLLTISSRQIQAQDVVEEWLGEDSDLLIESIDVEQDEVVVSLKGAGAAPPAEDLHDALNEAFARPLALTLRVTPVVETSLPARDLKGGTSG